MYRVCAPVLCWPGVNVAVHRRTQSRVLRLHARKSIYRLRLSVQRIFWPRLTQIFAPPEHTQSTSNLIGKFLSLLSAESRW